jgi:ornithine cyclodeaminase/alanine dehydrogenase-like protein (mu-crystallin family)
VKVPGQDAVAVVMPGRCEVPLGLGAKIVSVFPRNPAAGRPLIHAAVVLLDGETGEVAALLEGTELTAIRTGAASGLATDLLARRDARRVAIIGSGVQARTQLLAVCCVRKIEYASVYSRTPAHAARFADGMAGVEGVPERIKIEDSARDAALDADIICTATSAASPVLRADDVAPGTHINAIGSFTPEMRELDPALVARARVVVDQREAAMAEAGEVIAAVRGGLITEKDLIELGQIVNGAVAGRTNKEEITLFKSVGLAVQDLCAGARAEAEARRSNLGVELEL